MEYFVKPDSIVRRIWGRSDTILFIFSGAAAEFALNKAVDWLYFTGQIPADPIGRLFSTVSYAQKIVFAPKEEAEKTIDKINFIHAEIEKARGEKIPDWSFRDVLFLLIYYSIASFELLERKLTPEEKEEVFAIFLRIGKRMQIPKLPATYEAWLPMWKMHLQKDLQRSRYTDDLFLQYKKHLGNFRYKVLIESQKLVMPQQVGALLGFKRFSWLSPVVPLYKFSRLIKMDGFIKAILWPPAYTKQIKELDIVPT